MPDKPRYTTIMLRPGETVEIVRAPCGCPEGDVCQPDSPFASVCPRRLHPEDAALLNQEDGSQ